MVDFLLSNGYSVTIVDDLSTGSVDNLNLINPNLIFIKDSVQCYFERNFELFDCVFHLAAQASVPLSVEKFSSSTLNNLESTIKVFDYCKSYTIPCVYASSSAVYGNLEFSSEEASIDLLSPYAVDKYSMELYSNILHKIHKVPFWGFRFFNVYGPRQDPKSPYSGVISIFIDKLLSNSQLYINDGRQTRDFVYVEDVVKLIFKAYERLISNPGNYVSNLGTGKSITINHLFEIIKAQLDSNIIPIYRSLPKGDPFISSCDNTYFEELFSSFNFTNLEDGIAKTLRCYKNDF